MSLPGAPGNRSGNPSGRRQARSAMVLIALLFCGCIDLLPVSPPPGRPALLNLFLRLSDASAGAATVSVGVTAVLDPGVDQIGRPRGVQDDRLIIAGVVIEPADEGTGGLLVYASPVPIPREQLVSGVFEVKPPHVDGVEAAAFDVKWALASRVDAGPASVPEGSELSLGIVVRGLPGIPEPVARRWSVSVFGSEGWYSRGSDGLPPARIDLPAELLTPPGGSVIAIVNFSQSAEVISHGGAFVTRLELSQELRWELTIDE